MNTRYRFVLVIALAIFASVIGYAPTSAQGNTYTVREGDTLYSIAVRNGTTPEYLMTLNGLSSPLIYVGQVIIVSGAAAPAPAPAPGTATHTVQYGDTLFNIAYRYNLSVDTLKALNGLTSDIIYIGQVLRVSGTAPAPAPAPAPSTGGARHTVVLGDTLTGIAARYGTTIEAIQRANGLATDFIYIGQVLVIPGVAAPAPAPQQAPQPPVFYYVQPGDSLGRIAEEHGVSVGALAQLNNLKVTDWVYTGQRLLIPSGIYTPAPPAHPAPAPTPRPAAPAATPRPQPTATPNNAPPYVPPAPPENTPPVVTRVWTAEITENNCTRKDTLAVTSVVRITVEGRVGQGVDLYAKPKQPANYLTYVVTGTKPELGPTGAEIAPLRAGNYVLSAPGLADISFYVDGTCSISVNFKQVPA